MGLTRNFNSQLSDPQNTNDTSQNDNPPFNYASNLSGNESDYNSASFEIKFSSTILKSHKIQELITNEKVANFIFNGEYLDTLKVKNIYEIETMSLDEENSENSPGTGFSPTSISNLQNLASTEDPQNNETLLATLTNLEFLNKLSKSSIVEVMFILNKLMFGTKKGHVQDRLKKVGIVSIINKLYCLLQKTMDYTTYPGKDMKIQILKLAINYMSRNSPNLDNKLDCISREELILILKQEIAPCLLQHYIEIGKEAQKFAMDISMIPSTISLRKSDDYNETELASLKYDFGSIKTTRGFISKIIESFIHAYGAEMDTSHLRYWQSSSIEAFVRGANPFLQLFIARSEILKFLINDILTITAHDNQNLQTAFDIIGETIKFNKRTILIFEASIRKESLEIFKEKCISHLIDSNVFLRSILLTLYECTMACSQESTSKDTLFNCPFMENSSICAFVGSKISEIVNGILSILTVKR